MIFQLVEEGEIKAHRHTRQILPARIPNAAKITIAQILNHRSGIHNLEARWFMGKAAENKG